MTAWPTAKVGKVRNCEPQGVLIPKKQRVIVNTVEQFIPLLFMSSAYVIVVCSTG